MNLILGVYFGLTCLRSLLFGSTHSFRVPLVDYSQYSVINANIGDRNVSVSDTATGVLGWAMFGLSPSLNDDAVIKGLYHSIKDPSNRTRRDVDQNDSDLEELIAWFRDNRFMISISALMIIVSTIFLGHLVMEIKRRRNRPEQPTYGVTTSDGAVFRLKSSYFSPTYISFIITVLLTSYCNIATVTIAQILDFKTITFPIALFTIGVLITYVFAFPFFVAKTLFDRRLNRFDKKTLNTYGSLYLGLKGDNGSIYMMAVLARQLLYAIVINISNTFNVVQNSMFLLINCLFLGYTLYLAPFESRVTEIQSFVLTATLVLVSCANYFILGDTDHETATRVWFSSIIVLQSVSITVYFVMGVTNLLLPYFRKNTVSHTLRRDPIRVTSGDRDRLIELHPVDYVHDNGYTVDKRIRLAHEIEESCIDI